jgi:hypothetical protein
VPILGDIHPLAIEVFISCGDISSLGTLLPMLLAMNDGGIDGVDEYDGVDGAEGD